MVAGHHPIISDNNHKYLLLPVPSLLLVVKCKWLMHRWWSTKLILRIPCNLTIQIRYSQHLRSGLYWRKDQKESFILPCGQFCTIAMFDRIEFSGTTCWGKLKKHKIHHLQKRGLIRWNAVSTLLKCYIKPWKVLHQAMTHAQLLCLCSPPIIHWAALLQFILSTCPISLSAAVTLPVLTVTKVNVSAVQL